MGMKTWITIGLLTFVVCRSVVQAQQVQVAPDQQFLILEITRLATFVSELNDAAKRGFRLKMSAVEGARVTALMERVATPPDVYEYRTVSTFTSKAGDKEMNSSAAEGFRVVPHTFMVKKGITVFNVDNVVVMEKAPNQSGRYEYKTIGAVRTGTFEKELKGALGDGWMIFDMVYGQILLERPKQS